MLREKVGVLLLRRAKGSRQARFEGRVGENRWDHFPVLGT